MSEAKSRLKPFTLNVRLTEDQRLRLDKISSFGPYDVSITDIVVRGIELAALELEAMETARKGGAA